MLDLAHCALAEPTHGTGHAHAASIGSLVAVANLLVVFNRIHHHDRRAVRQDMNRDLLSNEILFDHDLATGIAEMALFHDLVDHGAGLFSTLNNEHAFASSQAVRLDDHRPRLDVFEIVFRGTRTAKAAPASGGYAVTIQEFFCEQLGALELSSCRTRPKDGEARFAQLVRQAEA